ncbi:hypothetical protein FB451DRAFT_1360339 [Mycena latifolia]|nr:hypothetical protein FB451DRAFT_1360339 [Mycena latifolia]
MPCANMNLSFLIPCCFLTLGACTLDDRLHRGSHPTVGVPVFGILQGTRMCGEEKLEKCGMYSWPVVYNVYIVYVGIMGDGSTIYNEGLNRIWSRSDELIESYYISDQDPQRVNINFLRRSGLVFLSQPALRQFLAVPGLRRLNLLP